GGPPRGLDARTLPGPMPRGERALRRDTARQRTPGTWRASRAAANEQSDDAISTLEEARRMPASRSPSTAFLPPCDGGGSSHRPPGPQPGRAKRIAPYLQFTCSAGIGRERVLRACCGVALRYRAHDVEAAPRERFVACGAMKGCVVARGVLAGLVLLCGRAGAGPFADRVVAYQIGTGGGGGQDEMPGVVLGPPRGGGAFQGSTDTL